VIAAFVAKPEGLQAGEAITPSAGDCFATLVMIRQHQAASLSSLVTSVTVSN
jgi:hypothetical protein